MVGCDVRIVVVLLRFLLPWISTTVANRDTIPLWAKSTTDLFCVYGILFLPSHHYLLLWMIRWFVVDDDSNIHTVDCSDQKQTGTQHILIPLR